MGVNKLWPIPPVDENLLQNELLNASGICFISRLFLKQRLSQAAVIGDISQANVSQNILFHLCIFSVSALLFNSTANSLSSFYICNR